MLHQIRGSILELTPSLAVIECGGVGFGVVISESTYRALVGRSEARLYTVHQIVEHDQEIRLYGFLSPSERAMYRLLKGVKGVGGSTAMAILSQLEPAQLAAAIFEDDAARLTRIKGIGSKTAQRIIIELKDRLQQAGIEGESTGVKLPKGDMFRDAALALVGLGYSQKVAETAVQRVAEANPTPESLEQLVRLSLQAVK